MFHAKYASIVKRHPDPAFLCLKTIKTKAGLCVVDLISVHWRFNGHDFEL